MLVNYLTKGFIRDGFQVRFLHVYHPKSIWAKHNFSHKCPVCKMEWTWNAKIQDENTGSWGNSDSVPSHAGRRGESCQIIFHEYLGLSYLNQLGLFLSYIFLWPNCAHGWSCLFNITPQRNGSFCFPHNCRRGCFFRQGREPTDLLYSLGNNRLPAEGSH